MGDIVEEYSNPNRSTRPDSETGDSGTTGPKESGSDRGRKKRVTVTPRDYDRMEAAAEELGMSKSALYRFALKRLLDDMNLGR
jgi:hypothetical protein